MRIDKSWNKFNKTEYANNPFDTYKNMIRNGKSAISKRPTEEIFKLNTNSPYKENLMHRQNDSSYTVSHDNTRINLQVNSKGIFDNDFSIHESAELRREPTDNLHEFRSSVELAEEENFPQNLENHNAFLMKLSQELENIVIINKKKAMKGFKNFAKNSESTNEMYRTKGSFFLQSDSKTQDNYSVVPNNDDLNQTQGKRYLLTIF